MLAPKTSCWVVYREFIFRWAECSEVEDSLVTELISWGNQESPKLHVAAKHFKQALQPDMFIFFLTTSMDSATSNCLGLKYCFTIDLKRPEIEPEMYSAVCPPANTRYHWGNPLPFLEEHQQKHQQHIVQHRKQPRTNPHTNSQIRQQKQRSHNKIATHDKS